MSEHGGGEQPIIIKKVHKGDHGHHGGAWKVAYADFVTAMMSLFIVLWILGNDSEIKEAVSSYFSDPVGYYEGSGVSMIKGVMQTSMSSEQLVDVLQALSQEQQQSQFAETGQGIMDAVKENPEYQELFENIVIEYLDEGMRIELIEAADDMFFEIGSPNLNQKALKVLELIGQKLATLNNKIIVEGHTDSRPVGPNMFGRTNFELSAERANSARRAIMQGGLQDNKVVQVIGWADNKLRIPADPYDSRNRRVSILVKYQSAK